MFTNLNLTDMETCYKAVRAPIIESIRIEENRFGFEPEITAKLARQRCRIYEIGISYNGRTYEEGKKIGWRDGFRAIYAILKYNLQSTKRSTRNRSASQMEKEYEKYGILKPSMAGTILWDEDNSTLTAEPILLCVIRSNVR